MENKLREIKKEFEGLYYWRYVVPKKDRMSAQEYNKRFESLINEHYERKECEVCGGKGGLIGANAELKPCWNCKTNTDKEGE